MQGETYSLGFPLWIYNISIHSPYAGRDEENTIWQKEHRIFQSTLPMQGETYRQQYNEFKRKNFNPLSLCRERPTLSCNLLRLSTFQSTLPMQGETGVARHMTQAIFISIHSPYAGRDHFRQKSTEARKNFNPLSLCRERPKKGGREHGKYYFNPLSLCRERLLGSAAAIGPQHFNPLSLCRERLLGSAAAIGPQHFNPLSLCRERPNSSINPYFKVAFQSTLPIQGETWKPFSTMDRNCISIHSPYTGRDCTTQGNTQ